MKTMQEPALSVRTVADELIAAHELWENGADPWWCLGCTTIAREGDVVWAASSKRDPKAQALCHMIPRLMRRDAGGRWEVAWSGETASEREPTPVARLNDGRILLSLNTAVEKLMFDGDRCIFYRTTPHILMFDGRSAATPAKPIGRIDPVWDQKYDLAEHSYRGFAVDAEANRLFITQQARLKKDWDQAWYSVDLNSGAYRNGVLKFPMRGCYVMPAVKGKQVHVVAVSDEVEPNALWKKTKFEITKRQWDYDFRMLFYTWTPDVESEPFSVPLTFASMDETAGHIRHCDIHIESPGVAHVLYIDQTVWMADLRDRLFPQVPITISLKHVVFTEGRVTSRRTLCTAHEIMGAAPIPERWSKPVQVPMSGPVAEVAKFHVLPDGRVTIFWVQREGEVRTAWIAPADGAPSAAVLPTPIRFTFNASVRAGNRPSNRLDLYGCAAANDDVRYVQLQVD